MNSYRLHLRFLFLRICPYYITAGPRDSQTLSDNVSGKLSQAFLSIVVVKWKKTVKSPLQALFTLAWIFLAARKKILASLNTLDVSWWILFKLYLLSVCNLAAEKLEFQLVLNFSLPEKSTQVWIGLHSGSVPECSSRWGLSLQFLPRCWFLSSG